MNQFSGITYKLDVDSQENMEDLIYAYGVRNLEAIRGAVTRDSFFTMTVDGDTFTQSTQTGDYKEVFSYRLGVPFQQVAYDGRRIDSLITERGPTTHYHVQDFEGGLKLCIEKTFTAEKLVLVLTLGDITARREYLAMKG